MGLGTDMSSAVLILGFESGIPLLTTLTPDQYLAHVDNFDAWMMRALAICKKHGGSFDSENVATRATDKHGITDEDRAEGKWKKSFLRAPYIRDWLVTKSVIIETFETAVTWDQFETFHRAIVDAVTTAIHKWCGTGNITYRFTHVYPGIYLRQIVADH